MKNSKSIEELENHPWQIHGEYPTQLIKNCAKYRKIPIHSLTIEQLRLLISQRIGTQHILDTAINKLKLDMLSEGDLYKGDLLVALSNISTEIGKENKKEFQLLLKLVKSAEKMITFELGEKKFFNILKNLEDASQQ